MDKQVCVIGGGLAGSEVALTLALHGVSVRLYEMRPQTQTPVHHTTNFAELVCSNSLKSEKPDSAAGMLKAELEALGSSVYAAALRYRVAAGGALAVDREAFSADVTSMIESNPLIEVFREEVKSVEEIAQDASAVVLATGPLTSDALAADIVRLTGDAQLAFYDAAAPIVMADSIDMTRAFKQSRYEQDAPGGDYINCPFTKDEYEQFIEELINAKRVVNKDFETADLFQACQPIEEIARRGTDAPRFGPLKPVGLTDPATGRRPWAALQLRAEDAYGQSFNLVGFQTNLTFPEQRRVFSMIPGLENAEFARYGVMHRNTYVDAPKVLDWRLQLNTPEALKLGVPVFIAGQLAGTEGYCEAIRSGLHVAISVLAVRLGEKPPVLSPDMVFGALLDYATNPATSDYQPMHVNFGILPPFETRIRNKKERYAKYAQRGALALERYVGSLKNVGLLA
jgi:methylenetetrahydrofolate--tRNA-(uracil-5-)-methyltransferase